MTELEAAWAAVHENTPDGWHVGRPGFEERLPRSDDHEAQERTLRLTHPKLDFYVDVTLRPYEGGTWIATADLDGEHDVGMDKEPTKAIEKALEPLG